MFFLGVCRIYADENSGTSLGPYFEYAIVSALEAIVFYNFSFSFIRSEQMLYDMEVVRCCVICEVKFFSAKLGHKLWSVLFRHRYKFFNDQII